MDKSIGKKILQHFGKGVFKKLNTGDLNEKRLCRKELENPVEKVVEEEPSKVRKDGIDINMLKDVLDSYVNFGDKYKGEVPEEFLTEYADKKDSDDDSFVEWIILPNTQNMINSIKNKDMFMRAYRRDKWRKTSPDYNENEVVELKRKLNYEPNWEEEEGIE